MYQYSLNWFLQLFAEIFDNVEKVMQLKERIEALIDYFNFSVYSNVCRSLFEQDKVIFSFLLLVRILEYKRFLDADEFRFLVSPLSALMGLAEPNPCEEWLPVEIWHKAQQLRGLSHRFETLPTSLSQASNSWQEIYSSG